MASKHCPIAMILPEVELRCTICQDLIREPVTIPCGHNFCKPCITKTWHTKVLGYYSCPHCRKRFHDMPLLSPNTMLLSLMEHVLNDKDGQSLVAQDDDVPCDICEDERLAATRACVTCLANFCTVHLQPHLHGALTHHHTCAPVQDKEALLCREHGKLLDFFCKRHWVSICGLCLVRHRKCVTATVQDMVEVWRTENESKMDAVQKMKTNIEEALDSIDAITEGVSTEAEKMKDDLEQHFQTLRKVVEDAQEKAEAFVTAEEQKALQETGEIQQQLQEKLKILEGMEEVLQNRSMDEGYFNFLMAPVMLPQLWESGRFSCPDIELNGPAVERMISHLQLMTEKLKAQLHLNLIAKDEEAETPADDFQIVSKHRKPRSRLLKFACSLTFQSRSASSSVLVSEDNCSITVESGSLLTWKDYQVDPDMGFRVLCTQVFRVGQHYWEVTTPAEGSGSWAVGVTLVSVEDRYRALGMDQRSWCVRWYTRPGKVDIDSLPRKNKEKTVKEEINSTNTKEVNNEYKQGFFAVHDGQMHKLSHQEPRKVGIHLDCGQCSVSFYSVSQNKVRLSYRFEVLLVEPVQPAIWLREPEQRMSMS